MSDRWSHTGRYTTMVCTAVCISLVTRRCPGHVAVKQVQISAVLCVETFLFKMTVFHSLKVFCISSEASTETI